MFKNPKQMGCWVAIVVLVRSVRRAVPANESRPFLPPHDSAVENCEGSLPDHATRTAGYGRWQK